MRAWILAALLAAVAFSGCFGGSGLDTQSVSRQLSERATSALGDDVELVALLGMEVPPAIAQQIAEDDECGSVPGDDAIGDGRADLWAHMYRSPASGAYHTIVTDGSGRVRCEHSGQDMPFTGAPLVDWSVDAPRAAAIIADSDDEFPQRYQESILIMLLIDAGTGPVWIFETDHPEAGSAEWIVDARNGTLLVDVPTPPMPVPLPQGGTASGVTTGTAVAAFIAPAEVVVSASGHAHLDLTIRSGDPAAGLLGYGVRITTPSGTESDEFIADGQTIRINAPAAGTYAVRAFPASAGSWSFTVEYCAYSDVSCADAPTGALALVQRLAS